MEAFKKLLKGRNKLIFLDFEGTQFSHEIIAVGAVKIDCDENGLLVNKDSYSTFKRYVKSYGPIGRIVANMTSIDNQILKEQGITFEQMLNEFENFIGEDFDRTAFIVFGSNDVKMIIDSIEQSNPTNKEIGYSICKKTIDFLSFISQYVKDDNGNNYSLTNYLRVFGKESYGKSHDPLNDSIDLMNLYDALMTQKDIIYKEYLHVLKMQKIFPQPVKKILNKLLNDENVSPKDFKKEITKYLE